MKLKLFFSATLILVLSSHAQQMVAQYDFSSSEQLSDWIVEGPGSARVVEGKLILEPEFFPLLKKQIDKGALSLKNNQDEYRQWLLPAMEKRYGKDIVYEEYFYHKKNQLPVFRGGHFNFWCKKAAPDNFAIEFDFKSLSPAPLQMIMFCALGGEGQSIFDPSMPSRKGLAMEIMYEPMTQYRISYFHPSRKTANMRRAPGRIMAASGKDWVSEDQNNVSHCRVERRGSTVRYLVNGELVLTYSDPNPLPGGFFGFRLMACAKGEYDNISVYAEGDEK